MARDGVSSVVSAKRYASARVVVAALAALALVLPYAISLRAGAASPEGVQTPGQQTPPAGARGAAGPRGPRFWWQDEQMRAELGLTQAQADRIQAIWDRDSDVRIERFRELRREEAALEELIAKRADILVVVQQVDGVAAADAAINKARIIMLYEMSQELTADQYAKLTAILDRERNRRSGGPGSR